MKLSFSPCTHTHDEDPRKVWEERNSPQSSKELIKISAKISNLEAWKKLENIAQFGVEIPLDKNEWSVTATIFSSEYGEICKQSFIKSIEISHEVIGPTGPKG